MIHWRIRISIRSRIFFRKECDEIALLLIRISNDLSPYATLRRSQISPNTKQRVNSSATIVPPSSYRLPPPLSSPMSNSSAIRTRSLENLHDNDLNHPQVIIIIITSPPPSNHQFSSTNRFLLNIQPSSILTNQISPPVLNRPMVFPLQTKISEQSNNVHHSIITAPSIQ